MNPSLIMDKNYMDSSFRLWFLVFVVFISGCAGNYKTASGKERNAWVDLIVIAAAMPNSSDSAATRARKTGIINGYLSEGADESYDANCACPYDTAADGTRCGARSAWSKPKGKAPACDYDRLTNQDFKDRWN